MEQRVGAVDMQKLRDLGLRIFTAPIEPLASKPGLADDVKKVGSELGSPDAKAVFHRMLANHAQMTGDRAGEIREYTVVVEEFPDTLAAPYCARELMARSEQAGDAATALLAATLAARVAQSEDEKHEANRATAYALVALGQHEEAIQHLDTVAQGEGSSTRLNQLRNNVAVRLLQAEQRDQAERLLLIAYESSPPGERDPGILGNLTSLASAQGRIEDVIRYQEEARALTKDPDALPAIDFAIAGSLFQLERFDEARARYQEVLNSKSRSADLPGLQKLAAENLENIAARLTSQAATSGFRPEPVKPNGHWWLLIGANVVFVSLIGIAYVWKRSRRSAP
jgi:tetratricopeptide (TPR) repeat protein